jgi:hypothetical protein
LPHEYTSIPTRFFNENASIFHTLKMALGFSSTKDFAAARSGSPALRLFTAARGNNP